MAAAIGGLSYLFSADQTLPSSEQLIAQVPLSPASSLHALARHVQSLLLLAIACVLIFAIAHHTNPSEASFRQYLTEQSFKRHLYRIDDDGEYAHDAGEPADNILGAFSAPTARPRFQSHPAASVNASAHVQHKSVSDNSDSPHASAKRLHFHGHASIALRTPPHFLRSFGILTIAAVTPADTSPPPPGSTSSGHSTSAAASSAAVIGTSKAARRLAQFNAAASSAAGFGHGSVVRASWFVGVFGRWWPGGTFPFDSVMFARDPDDPRSGVLSMRAVKQPVHPSSLPVKTSTHTSPATGASMRERSSQAPKQHQQPRPQLQQQTPLPARSSSPPPLPKSASLPLHDTKRVSSAGAHSSGKQRFVASPAPISVATSQDATRLGQIHANGDATRQEKQHPQLSHRPAHISSHSHPAHPSLSATAHGHGHSPSAETSTLLKDLSHELALAQNQVADSRAKLTSVENQGTASKAALQRELDAQREQKRREDTSRNELRTRTKALEDSKRHTDSTKRDAEKRLRAVVAARDSSTVHIAQLQDELVRLQQGMVADRERREASAVQTAAALANVTDQVAKQQREISVAESLIATLNARSRELEELVAPEAERNERLVADVEAKRERELVTTFVEFTDEPVTSHEPIQPVGAQRETTTWPPPPSYPAPQLPATQPQQQVVSDRPTRTILRRPSATSPSDPIIVPAPRSQFEPRSRSSTLLRSNSLNQVPSATHGSDGSVGTIGLGSTHSIFGSDISSLVASNRSTTFSPFGDDVSLSLSSSFTSDSEFGAGSDRTPSRFLPSSLLNPLDSPFSDAPINIPRSRPTDGGSGGRQSSLLADDPEFVWPPLGNTIRTRTTSLEHSPAPMRDYQQPQPFRSPPARNMPAAVSVASVNPPAQNSVMSRSGLNPDAKVFNPGNGAALASGLPVTRTRTISGFSNDKEASARLASPSVPYAAPSVVAAPLSAEAGGGTFFKSLRAFAPSPAEREALSRALGPFSIGGSTNKAFAPAPPAPAPHANSNGIIGSNRGWLAPPLPMPPATAATASAFGLNSHDSQDMPMHVPASAPASRGGFYAPLWAPMTASTGKVRFAQDTSAGSSTSTSNSSGSGSINGQREPRRSPPGSE